MKNSPINSNAFNGDRSQTDGFSSSAVPLNQNIIMVSLHFEGRKEMFYLRTHSVCNMASDIW